MRLMPRFLLSAAPLAALPGRAVAAGMPQLDFKNPLLQGQVIWGALIFIFFYIVLSRSALPRVDRVIRNRTERIQNDLDLARKAKREADQARKELLDARQKATDHAQANIQTIRDMAKSATESQLAATVERLEAEMREAELNIKTAHNDALHHVNEIASDTATSLINRLLGRDEKATVLDAIKRVQG
ncbi:hypothetical protein GT348_08670 [Aristophania vespae]|uniref:ATP synthase subunit b n=1 Tax=Aristophania vespae TaxID=2697033 RepID=A0A6P1NID2_9PROT|nr:hypothetical protein [Aristophania vespae]QHI94935.1 hypothetical protein GT348_00030 [Aristophania vespae]QHI96284.1 hypothetical protein GT348_08670 [Aristophania vespae]UMM64095.1 ATP synthase subunit b' [Aristophania vespae]